MCGKVYTVTKFIHNKIYTKIIYTVTKLIPSKLLTSTWGIKNFKKLQVLHGSRKTSSLKSF
jgi:hypothetical protein